MDSVFIYALNCPITGRTRYVGKAKNPQKRFCGHLCDDETNHRTNWIRSLRTRGLKPILEILDEVPGSEWPQWEVAWIEFFHESGFDLVNSHAGGEGGHTPSEETRKKLSDAKIGKPSWNKGKKSSEETRAKISLAATNISDETRKKMSDAKIGNPPPNKGKKRSEETRAKNSAITKAWWAKKKGETL